MEIVLIYMASPLGLLLLLRMENSVNVLLFHIMLLEGCNVMGTRETAAIKIIIIKKKQRGTHLKYLYTEI